MNDSTLDRLLHGMEQRSKPALPGSFAQDVLREIRTRTESRFCAASWLREITGLLLRPKFLAGSMAVALAVGITLPVILPRSASSAQVVNGLGLAVFSSSSVNMPSGLLARMP